jgi:hypothetical protein
LDKTIQPVAPIIPNVNEKNTDILRARKLQAAISN